MPGFSPRLNIPFPLSSESPNGPDQIKAVAESAIDQGVVYGQGLLSARPVSTSGSPGLQGRVYFATDTALLYWDLGTSWIVVGSPSTIADVRASRPSAASVQQGQRFFATDQVAEWIATGGGSPTWTRVGQQPGVTAINLTATASPGSILLQGQSWPATTGIYADIYAALGTPATVPDFRTFVPVGFKTADSSFGTLLATVGEKTHTLTTPEMPAHGHDVTYGAAGAGASTLIDADTAAGAFGTEATSSVGGGAAHANIQPSIVVNFEAKL